MAPGDQPEAGRAFAARGGRYKLVQARGSEPVSLPRPLRYELFDLQDDPSERVDVADRHPEVVLDLLRGYRAWFADVADPRNLQVPPIRVGAVEDDPAILTRQDWRGSATAWEPGEVGGWDVEVARGGRYDLVVFLPGGLGGVVRFQLGAAEVRVEAAPGARTVAIGPIELAPGPGRLQAWVDRPPGIVAAYRVEVRRRE